MPEAGLVDFVFVLLFVFEFVLDFKVEFDAELFELLPVASTVEPEFPSVGVLVVWVDGEFDAVVAFGISNDMMMGSSSQLIAITVHFAAACCGLENAVLVVGPS